MKPLMDVDAGRLTAARAGRAPGLALPGLAAALGFAALLQGAYWEPQLRLLAAGLAALLALTGVRARGSRLIGAGFGALAAGLLATGTAAGWPQASAKPAATLLVAAMAFLLASRAAARDGAEAVLESVVAVAAIVAAIGLAGVAWHHEPWAIRADTWRLASTLTYQNAAACLLAIALAPAAVLAARATSAFRRAALVTIVIALAATLSRGGYLAGAVAVTTLLALRALPPRALLRPAAASLVGIGAVLPATLGAPWSAPVGTAGVMLALGIAVARPRDPSRAGARGLVAVALTGAAVIALAVPLTQLGARFTFSTTDRSRVWGETVAQMDGNWALGTGPGTYRLVVPSGNVTVVTRHAHNEYLQALSETGVVGLGSVLVAIGLFGRALLRARPRTGHHLWACAVAGGLALLAQSAVDFVWRVPAIVAFAFVLLAVGMSGEPGSTSSLSRRGSRA